MVSKSKVYFFFDNVRITLKNRTKIKRIVELIFKAEKIKLDRLNYVFCTDEFLLTLNSQYLKHDYYTDTITFDLSQANQDINGEVYISVDRVRENAEILKVSLFNEIRRVIIHGALHLCGYGDKETLAKEKMNALEDFYLQKLV